MREIPLLLELERNPIRYRPKDAEIPVEFKDESNNFYRIAEHWFFEGADPQGNTIEDGWVFPLAFGRIWMHPNPELSEDEMRRVVLTIRTVLTAWEISHELKMAAAAYLLSEWFEIHEEEHDE